MIWILGRQSKYDNGCGPETEAVFSTKEKAEAYAKSHPIDDDWIIEGWTIF